MNAYNRNTGARIAGTYDLVPGSAGIDPDSWSRDAEGKLQFEFGGGGSKMFWDEQEQRTDEKGHPLFLDENGGICSSDDIGLCEEPKAPEEPAENEFTDILSLLDTLDAIENDERSVMDNDGIAALIKLSDSRKHIRAALMKLIALKEAP